MVSLKGEGAFRGVNLIAVTHENNATKDGKTQYFDVQVDARDRRGADQTNLHLVSDRVEKDGVTRYNNGAPYRASQFEAIKATAGPNSEPITNKAGERIGTAYGIKADLMPSGTGKGLLINTQTLAQSDFKVDQDTLDHQFAAMKTAKQARAAATNETEVATQAEVPSPAEPAAQAAALAQANAAELEPQV